MMPNNVRKVVLIAHIVFSIGWLGALICYLVLAITGLNSENTQTLRSAFIASDLIGWFVILPACLGSLLSGLILSLGSMWGLFKHYWVLIKFLLTTASTLLLVLHMQQISMVAELALTESSPNTELQDNASELVIKASGALLVLFINTAISVYKPWGLTTDGMRKLQEKSKVNSVQEFGKRKSWGRYILMGFLLLLMAFIILHLAGGGMRHH